MFDANKWSKEKYQKYVILLDKQKDKDTIQKIEKERQKGTMADLMRKLLK